MKFNAGGILTDEEVRQLTEAGCEIYPMKWVDTDKDAYLRFCSCKVQESNWLVMKNFETTEGLRTCSPAGDVDSLNIVRSCLKMLVFETCANAIVL